MAQPSTNETTPRAPGAAADTAIHTIRTLVEARDMRAAKQQLRRTQAHLDDHTWAMIGEIANTLRYRTHDVAIAKLRKLWRDNEQHRALIEACVPKTGERQYIPDFQPSAARRTEELRLRSARVTRRVDPAKRTDPHQRTGSAGVNRVDDYEDQLADGERKEQGTPRDELIVDRRDYDQDAAAEVTEPLCVSCRLERACIDRWTGQIQTGHGDDGLCGSCRDEGRLGIPELPLGHTPRQAIQARLDTIAANFDSHSPALFRHEWRYGNPATRAVTNAWVKQHNPSIVVKSSTPTEPVDMNGECAECGDWRQLRDDLCVDCHKGLSGDVVIAGTLEPLTVKGSSSSRAIDEDVAIEDQVRAHESTGFADNAGYRREFMQRLATGTPDDDPTTAAAKDHDKPAATNGTQRARPTTARSKGADPARGDSGKSSADSPQHNERASTATSYSPEKPIFEPSRDPAMRRRQRLRNRATVAMTSRGRRI